MFLPFCNHSIFSIIFVSGWHLVFLAIYWWLRLLLLFLHVPVPFYMPCCLLSCLHSLVLLFVMSRLPPYVNNPYLVLRVPFLDFVLRSSFVVFPMPALFPDFFPQYVTLRFPVFAMMLRFAFFTFIQFSFPTCFLFSSHECLSQQTFKLIFYHLHNSSEDRSNCTSHSNTYLNTILKKIKKGARKQGNHSFLLIFF